MQLSHAHWVTPQECAQCKFHATPIDLQTLTILTTLDDVEGKEKKSPGPGWLSWVGSCAHPMVRQPSWLPRELSCWGDTSTLDSYDRAGEGSRWEKVGPGVERTHLVPGREPDKGTRKENSGRMHLSSDWHTLGLSSCKEHGRPSPLEPQQHLLGCSLQCSYCTYKPYVVGLFLEPGAYSL